MLFTIALLSAVMLPAPTAVTSATEQHLMQSTLNLVVERNESLREGLVLVSCATGAITPTGGVPLERDESWLDLLERNASTVDLLAELPSSWRRFDDAAFRVPGGELDWQRLRGAIPEAKAVVRVSRPGISSDGLHAVVQAEVLLPDGMRGWHVYWLDRGSEGWVKVDHRTAWAPIGYSFPADGRWELASRSRSNQ